MRAVPDLIEFTIVFWTPAIHNSLQTFFFVDSGLRQLFIGNVWDGQELTHISSRQLFQCASVCNDMHPAADQQKANHRPGGGIFHHFVNADFVSTRATLKEKIVKKVELRFPLENTFAPVHGFPVESIGRAVCPEAIK